MRKTIILYLSIIGFIVFLSSCEKDGTNVTMLTDPIPPELITIPDLTLERANGSSTLTFVGTSVDPGFNASANYFLEACPQGNNFADAVTVFSDVQALEMKITVSDLNGILLKRFPADQENPVDFRLRSVLIVDAGTGALGTSEKPFEYISASKTANVTLYGLPKLELLNSGMDQIIESALGDGAYFGFAKLDPDMPFTLRDPDADIIYGANGANLAVDGNGIVASSTAGWYQLSVNTVALTYSTDAYMIGLVGSATPNGWDAPDQKMDYDKQTGTWNITIDLIDGFIKFRLNDGWAWNLGGTVDNLVHNGTDIPVTAGNYTISLSILNDVAGSETGTFTIVQN